MKRWMACALFALGCGGNGNNPDMGPSDTTMAEGDFHYYVVNKLTVPMQRADFAIDLNGDGHPDNQLGNIIGALAAQNLDTQTQIDMAVSSGDVVLLVSLQTKSMDTANNVGVTLYIGKSQMMPDFMSGMGMFTVDSAASGSGFAFFGNMNAKKFTSNNPVTTTHPVKMTLKLPLIQGGDPLNLTVNGAHIKFTTGSDAASGKDGLINGELHGSIKNADIQGSIVPAVAMLLSDRVKNCTGMPPDGGMCSSGDMQILQIFDTGGCMNTDGTMAKANDGKIDVCEVATNMIIMNVLAPDVQIFDSAGNYAPNAKNTMKDSLSLGLSFTAVASSKPAGL